MNCGCSRAQCHGRETHRCFARWRRCGGCRLISSSECEEADGGNRDLIIPGYAPVGAMIMHQALAGLTRF